MTSSSDSSVSSFITSSINRSAAALPMTRVAFERNFASSAARLSGTSGVPRLAALRLLKTRPSLSVTMTSPGKCAG